MIIIDKFNMKKVIIHKLYAEKNQSFKNIDYYI